MRDSKTVLYYTLGNGACRKALQWVNDHEIEIRPKEIHYISKTDLTHALSFSETGFYELLKQLNQCEPSVEKAIYNVFEMSSNDSIIFILEHPEVLKAPLIVDAKKLLSITLK
ncbi:ArsC/Spx/MgsR family protein [Lactococcus petauri]|uniref:ArsC/Spx/MgsR family protein n=1 Tax=Lactococcus petauri TaxID=1940789 RepID=UPI0018ABD4C1|nr:ArsC/Spx/MgsR family protein [Lactococcus petauri]MDC0826963.1 hypothetical protein [Lactococcus petauri]